MSIKLRNFESMILFFNGMYKLPVAPYPRVFDVIEHSQNQAGTAISKDPTEVIANRLDNFKKIIEEEISEIDDIKASLLAGFRVVANAVTEEEYTPLHFLTDMADWLVDIQIYCASEMARFGIPLEEVQRIVMESNFSKLGADGEPIYDERGKVQKGPMYWKPEPSIMILLAAKIAEHNFPGTGASNEP